MTTPANIVRCDISGIVQSLNKYDSSAVLQISQKVCGRMDTTFTVLVTNPLLASLDVGIGDEILILHAICYDKDGALRFKVTEENQLITLKKNLNQGSIDADKFI